MWVSRDPTFSTGKKTFTVRRGRRKHLCNFSGSICQTRRGHLDPCAVNVQKMPLGIVITWFPCRFDFGR